MGKKKRGIFFLKSVSTYNSSSALLPSHHAPRKRGFVVGTEDIIVYAKVDVLRVDEKPVNIEKTGANRRERTLGHS